MKNENLVINKVDALKSEMEVLELKLRILQRKRQLKVDTIDKKYDNKINAILRRRDFVLMQMEQGNEYVRKNLQTKGEK